MEKKTYLKARAKGEKTWIISELEDKANYEDDDCVEWEFSTIELTEAEKNALPEFQGY